MPVSNRLNIPMKPRPIRLSVIRHEKKTEFYRILFQDESGNLYYGNLKCTKKQFDVLRYGVHNYTYTRIMPGDGVLRTHDTLCSLVYVGKEVQE